MIAKRILSCIKGKQKGDVFVMVAASMAAVMFCGAAVIDLGSLYAHKSELQNAADAAALAGARAMADNEETIDEHPEADNIAETYVERNLGEGSSASHTFKAKSKNDAIYYRVVLEDDAPTYFYRYFFKTPPRISVEAIAAIASTTNTSKGNNPFEDLFIFTNGLDMHDPNQPNGTTNSYDGNIVCTDKNNVNNVKGSADDNKNIFVTEKGKDKFNKVHRDTMIPQLTEANACYYGSDGSPMDKSGENYWHKAEYKDININEFADNVKKMAESSNNIVEGINAKNFSATSTNQIIKDNDKVIYIKSSDSSNQVDIKLGAIPDSDLGPLYIYCDPNLNIVNFQLSESMSRPIIFCYTGTSDLKVNMQNNTFRGIIYAPNCTFDGSNCDGLDFEGTIAAKNIEFRGRDAKFKYSDFSDNNSSGSESISTSVTVSSSSQISLVPPDSISWD